MANHPEEVTAADRELADHVAWSMALEGRPLTPESRERLLEAVVRDRLRRDTS